MSGSRTDVLVVGAGPVGLTAAAAIERQGLTCRIVDKASAPSDKSKALVVWSRTLELLDDLGLATTFVDAGMRATGVSVYGDGKRLVHLAIAGVESPFGYPLMLPQNETERLLSEYLTQKGIQIERSVELLAFKQRPDGVACSLRHPDGTLETVEAGWLVGCDGAHSTVRHALGMEFAGSADPNDWLLADVLLEGPLARDEVSVFWHEKGALVFFPIDPHSRFRVIADLGMTRSVDRPPDPTLAEVQAKVDERGPGGISLHDPIWLAGFRINERKVANYREGRVFLAGDAAHIHSPAGGQGMNTGMQDAFNLAWKLALVQRGQGRHEILLDSYTHERSEVGDQVLHAAAAMTTVATLRNPVAQFFRNHVASLATSFDFVQDRIKNAITELSIAYRDSPLSKSDAPWMASGIRSGDRFPDAAIACARTGGATTLLKTLRGDRFALFLIPGAAERETLSALIEPFREAVRPFPEVIAIHVLLAGDGPWNASIPESSGASIWQEVDHRLGRELGFSGDRTLLLVRPDGYVAYRGHPATVEGLVRYLDSVLIR
jgi:2-polyprenyl-6-methoxyphenol hydroxylase-like FAD-dependent oxidoreductase